jgi:CBS domain-containing protein
LTAEEVMDRRLVTVPRGTSLRDAAGLFCRDQLSEAVVVDDLGRYLGMFCAADVVRWIVDGCAEARVDPGRTCPYQVKGRLLSGEETMICTLADGSCLFQAVQPITGGRHTDICMRAGTEEGPFGTVPGYMTTDPVTVRPQTPLSDLMRMMTSSRTDLLVVVDEQHRPVGTVSATDILAGLATSVGSASRDSGQSPRHRHRDHFQREEVQHIFPTTGGQPDCHS